MKRINLFNKSFFRRGYVEIKDVKKVSTPIYSKNLHSIEPNLMDNTKIKVIFGEVLRGLNY